MRRGGRRRQWITTAEAAVGCPDGRWGRRRTRVTECWAVLRAEDVYTSLLRGPEVVAAAGSHGNVTWAPGGRSFTASFEVRENRVWRHGRVFLRCSGCSRLATRLYVPTDTAWLACRRCWGLTYHSRTHHNYKDGGGLLAYLGASHRIMAQMQTEGECERRREASIERWAERRAISKRKARAAKRRQATAVPLPQHT